MPISTSGNDWRRERRRADWDADVEHPIEGFSPQNYVVKFPIGHDYQAGQLLERLAMIPKGYSRDTEPRREAAYRP